MRFAISMCLTPPNPAAQRRPADLVAIRFVLPRIGFPGGRPARWVRRRDARIADAAGPPNAWRPLDAVSRDQFRSETRPLHRTVAAEGDRRDERLPVQDCEAPR